MPTTEELVDMGQSIIGFGYADLTFTEALEANRVRCRRWHDEDSEPWSLADWSNAMCGEAGELANVVKKLRRHQTGTASELDPEECVLRSQAADEIADVFLYLGLLADAIGVDMPAAIVRKFAAVSERQGFPDRIEAHRVAELVGRMRDIRNVWQSGDKGPGEAFNRLGEALYWEGERFRQRRDASTGGEASDAEGTR